MVIQMIKNNREADKFDEENLESQTPVKFLNLTTFCGKNNLKTHILKQIPKLNKRMNSSISNENVSYTTGSIKWSSSPIINDFTIKALFKFLFSPS